MHKDSHYHLRFLIGYSQKMMCGIEPLPENFLSSLADIHQHYNVTSHLFFAESSKVVTPDRAKKLMDTVIQPANLSEKIIFNDGVYRIDGEKGVQSTIGSDKLDYIRAETKTYRKQSQTYRDLAGYFNGEMGYFNQRQFVLLKTDPKDDTIGLSKMDIKTIYVDQKGMMELRETLSLRTNMFPNLKKG